MKKTILISVMCFLINSLNAQDVPVASIDFGNNVPTVKVADAEFKLQGSDVLRFKGVTTNKVIIEVKNVPTGGATFSLTDGTNLTANGANGFFNITNDIVAAIKNGLQLPRIFKIQVTPTVGADLIYQSITVNWDKLPDDKDKSASIDTYVGILANANFTGNNKFLSNLTPIVTLGGIVNIDKSFSLDINPYIGSDIDTKDSSSFIPALMLPGRAGLIINSYFTVGIAGDLKAIFMPFGFGLKLMPNIQDSGTVIWQHNLRCGVAFRYADVAIVGIQYTHGWHNTTSESGRFFSKVFGNDISSEIDYLSISGQFLIKPKDKNEGSVNNYVFVEWRGLQSKKRFLNFTNNSLLTIGVRKDISATQIFSANSGGRKSKHVHNVF